MFKKPLTHQSNATPIRSSARRQLLSAILEQYPSLLPQDGMDDNNKKELSKLILPEGVRTATFETSTGLEGTFWLSPNGDPLWMTLGRNSKEYIPTLFLLSLPLPRPPLPIIQIYHPLPTPIRTGAPLFIPAVRNIDKPHRLPAVNKNQLVAFVTSPTKNNCVHYIGVGRVAAEGGMKGAWERRVDHLMDGGDREEGKFSDILCIIDDHLWDLGSKPTLSTFILPPPQIPLVAPPEGSEPIRKSSSPPAVQQLSISEEDAPEASIPVSTSLSASEISSLLSLSLLQALSGLQPSAFPMSASLLYSSHILPSRPAHIPKAKRDEVVIGKSEWKKLAKWMKEAGKEGIVKIKESKGEFIVVSFDSRHPSLQAHVDYMTIAQEEAKAAKKAAREAASDQPTKGGKSSSKQSLDIEELWKPASGAISFWEACGISKSDYHSPSTLKQAVDGYITSHNLLHPTNHRFILLDGELGRAVGIKKPEVGEKMARDEIFSKLKNGVSWVVSIGGTIKKGALQPITMTVKSRGGRRTVTHVTGLELFNVDIESFAEDMRKRCAGSASIQPREGVSPKLGLQEVLVQGSQQKLITEALVERGVPKRWIMDEGDKKGKK
ncbi:translation initiation factor 2D [Cryptococcus neoformans Ze90-1]|nr:translation initiation factor 2D [Cryptococcus neoformans var. grubii Ze90-1]